MKNGLLVWNVVLTLIAGYLLFSHFNNGKKAGSQITNEKKDTLTSSKDFRIAYFEMDSIEAHFDMVKEVKDELGKKEASSNIQMDRAAKDYENKRQYYQGKQKDMTQQEFESAVLDLKRIESDLSNLKQRLDQEYSELALRRGKEVKMTIEEFLKEYNAARNYAYIVAYEQGLFYYKDSAYNITSDVIRGLNDKHRPDKKN